MHRYSVLVLIGSSRVSERKHPIGRDRTDKERMACKKMVTGSGPNQRWWGAAPCAIMQYATSIQNEYNHERGGDVGIIRAPTNAENGNSLMVQLDEWCKAVQQREKNVSATRSAVDKPSTVEVEIFGITTIPSSG